MNPTVLLMLSNLLHLQNHLDPFLSSTAASTPTLANSSTSTSTTTAAPLLFFTIFSILSYASTTLSPSPSLSSPLSDFQSLAALPSPLRDSRFRSRFGLSFSLFTSLVRRLTPLLPPLPSSLPVDYAVSIVLSRLALSLSPRALSRSHSLPPSLISRLTNSVTRVLATEVYSLYVKPPSSARLLEIIQEFRNLTSLPNVSGAIDGSPVRISSSCCSDEGVDAYRCRYGYPAVLLQVVADHRKVFWDVCVKAPGSANDASHFRDSQLYVKFTSGEIFDDNAIVNLRGHRAGPCLIGDWAFPLMSFLLTPFTVDGTGTPAQNGFDAAVMRGREASVVAAIELLKGRWKILREVKNVGIGHVAQTVVACCVLHNMCQISGEPEEEEELFGWQDPRESAPPARVSEREKSFHQFGESLRQAMADDLHDRLQRRGR